jgi:hypothetical protein
MIIFYKKLKFLKNNFVPRVFIPAKISSSDFSIKNKIYIIYLQINLNLIFSMTKFNLALKIF